MTDTLLVPSAKLVPDELKLDLGPIPTCLIPLQGRSMLHHIEQRYRDGGDVTPYIACRERIEAVQTHVRQTDSQWQLIELDRTRSLGETVHESLERLMERGDLTGDLYVNFADTLVDPLYPDVDGDFVSYSTVDRSFRWTTFETDSSGRIDSVTEKFTTHFDGVKKVFTGLFKLTDPHQFAACLADALERSRPDDEGTLDPFYDGLLRYLSERSYELIPSETWIDAGHLDTYYQAKKRFLNSREFNHVSVSDNTITKRSDNARLIVNELEWYQSLPETLEPYAPQIYSYSTETTEPSITMEYVGYPSLGDMQLHGSHGLHIWDNIFARIFDLLDEFSKYTYSPGRDVVETTLREMYYEKTVNRLGRIEGDASFTPYFEDTVTINGHRHPGVGVILDELDDVLRRSGLYEGETLVAVHGDLCFHNILFDVRNEIIKLIDPRGEFGPNTIYGDHRYDLAKLRHSVAGHYEHIINDMFELDVDPAAGTVNYEVLTETAHAERQSIFESRLRNEYPDAVDAVALLESLLFLSMVPLHDDSEDRQHCMLAQGIEKYHEVVENT
jgi:hypothetical protein